MDHCPAAEPKFSLRPRTVNKKSGRGPTLFQTTAYIYTKSSPDGNTDICTKTNRTISWMLSACSGFISLGHSESNMHRCSAVIGAKSRCSPAHWYEFRSTRVSLSLETRCSAAATNVRTLPRPPCWMIELSRPPRALQAPFGAEMQEDRFHLLQLFSVVEDSLCVLKEETRPLAFYPKDVFIVGFIVSAGIVADGPRHFFKRERVFIEG